MQLIAPDILADAKGLSVSLCVTGLVAGAALWLLGWWSHRFWVVLCTTVVAGVFGLYEGPALRAQPLVVAVLLAVAAGLMAVGLVRLVGFAAGGLGLLAATQALGPSTEHALIFFLSGGIMGLILFRQCVMVLTSLGGTLLMGYAGLCLADSLHKLDAADWAAKHVALANWSVAGAAFLGFCLQLFLNRRKPRPDPNAKKAKTPPPPEEKPEKKPRFLVRLGGELFRRAG
jgi:hypothetical protein